MNLQNFTYGPLNCQIDIHTPGKRFNYIHLDHSDVRHAFGTIQIPIAIIKGGSGPCVLLSAGNHGDEYEGQCILRRLIEQIDYQDVNGTLIVLPAINMPAVEMAQRTSPLDNGNLNRSFPGHKEQGPTKAIAGFVTQCIFPLIDYGIDFHSGGSSATYVNSAFLSVSHADDVLRKSLQLVEAFAAPFTLVAPSGNTATDMDSCAHSFGIPFISCELGGAGQVSIDSLSIGWQGLLRVLSDQVNVSDRCPLVKTIEKPLTATQYVDTYNQCSYVTANHRGLFEPLQQLGKHVTRHQDAARIYGTQAFLEPLEKLSFNSSGIVIIQRRDSLVSCGDHLYCVATPITKTQVLNRSTTPIERDLCTSSHVDETASDHQPS